MVSVTIERLKKDSRQLGWFADRYYNRKDFTVVEIEHEVSRQNSNDSNKRKVRESLVAGIKGIGGAVTGGLLGGASTTPGKDSPGSAPVEPKKAEVTNVYKIVYKVQPF